MTKWKADFGALLGEIKARIQSGQTRALVAVNRELVRLYWDIGRIIQRRQKGEGWGAAIVPRLSRALHNELPELKGFSERNIERMLAFHREYPSLQASLEGETKPPTARTRKVSKVPLPVALLPESLVWSIPWAHHIILMEKVKDVPARRWYMEQTLAHGWSRDTLALQILASAHDTPWSRHLQLLRPPAAAAIGTDAAGAQGPLHLRLPRPDAPLPGARARDAAREPPGKVPD